MHDDTETGQRSLIDDLQAGVPPALALLAGLQLGLFTALADGPFTPAEAATRLGLDADRLARLMRALVVAGLLRVEGGRFANGAEADARLVRGKPGFIGDVEDLIADIWGSDLRTAESIRSKRPAALHDFSAMDAEALGQFLQSIAPFGRGAAGQIAARFDFSGCASVIDIGGGAGAVLDGLLWLHPGMRGVLFELPAVAGVAGRLVAGLSTADRITVEAGDILAAPPQGLHDAALLRAVAQVLSPRDASRAIGNAAACLRPGGTLYITGAGIVDDTRLAPAAGVYFDLTLMNFYPEGRAHTIGEHFNWLQLAGLANAHHAALPSGSPVIWAQKPA